MDEYSVAEARKKQVAHLRVIWDARRFLWGAVLTGLVLSTAAAFLIPEQYTAVARLLPPASKSSSSIGAIAALSGGSGGLASAAQSALGVGSSSDFFVGILQSNTVSDDVIQKFDLQRVYHDRYLEDARQELAHHTGLTDDTKTGIVTIKVVDRNAQRATAMVQEYIKELNWVVTNETTSSAHRERVFLGQRLNEVRQELETAENNFSQFASKKTAINVPEQGKAMLTSLGVLQDQLIAADSELDSLRQVYSPDNVRVRSTEARVSSLRASLEKMAGRDADEKSSASVLYPSIRALPVLGVSYSDLLRRTKVEEATYEALTREYEQAKVEEAKEIPTVKVLDPPLVPQKKSFPPRLTFIVLGTLLSAILSMVWALCWNVWQSMDPADPRKVMAREVWHDMRSSLPGRSKSGSGGAESAQGL